MSVRALHHATTIPNLGSQARLLLMLMAGNLGAGDRETRSSIDSLADLSHMSWADVRCALIVLREFGLISTSKAILDADADEVLIITHTVGDHDG